MHEAHAWDSLESRRESIQAAGGRDVDEPLRGLIEPARSHRLQIARADEGFVGTGRQIAAGQRETGQGQAQAHHAGAHADARGQFEFLVIQPVRPGIDLFEEGDEFFGRVLDRLDAFFDGGFEHAPTLSHGEAGEHCDDRVRKGVPGPRKAAE
ncbi:Uncharacterised protein [Mycobacteroides abscessus subsp. abscessus]|nr:Uncharacterised protein [Mycobacteroides abscessus subsp. abscessus]